MTELERLERELKEARDCEAKVRSAIRECEKDDERSWLELKERLDAIREERFGPGLKEAQARVHDAKTAFELERIRLAESGQAESPWPVGTVLVLWDRKHYLSRDTTLVATSERAIIGVYKSRDQLADNYSAYAIPEKGDIVAFLLKKDGTPSKRCLSLSRLKWREWHPEGVDPNTKREAA